MKRGYACLVLRKYKSRMKGMRIDFWLINMCVICNVWAEKGVSHVGFNIFDMTRELVTI